jgi:predicted transcriptional regulator
MITPQLEGRIQHELSSGKYQTPEELLNRALDVLQAEAVLDVPALRDTLEAKLAESFAAVERGDTMSAEEFEAELDAWSKQHLK